MKEKMLKLYKDWTRSQDLSSLIKAKNTLKEAKENPANFNKLAKMMGMDGDTFLKYFEESKLEFSDNVFTAKRKAASYILEEAEIAKPIDKLGVDNFSLAWEPTTDGANTMASYIEAGTPNGSASEIVKAIVSGNMEMAAALTAAAWNNLMVGDRNAILNIAKVHGGYNTGSGVSKDSGITKFYTVDVTEGPIKKKGDMSKNEFLAKAFPFSDPQNTKLYQDD